MTPKRPPRIATWILKHFGSGPDIDVLLGDLAEQYLHNHSAIWYWRQTMKAIPVSFVRDVLKHKWIAGKALLTGWVLWLLAGWLIFPVVFYDPSASPGGPQVGVAFVPSDPLGSLMTLMSLPALGIMLFHPKSPLILPMAFLFATALPLIVGTLSGWLAARWQLCAQTDPPTLRIARVHRDQRSSIVLLFAGSVLLINLLPFALWVGPEVEGFSMLVVVNTVASAFGILFGGGLFRDRSSQAQTSN